jgi:hypothetical protein
VVEKIGGWCKEQGNGRMDKEYHTL